MALSAKLDLVETTDLSVVIPVLARYDDIQKVYAEYRDTIIATGHSYEFLDGLDFRLFQRLANWAVNLTAVLPVMKYLPRRGTMRHWT